MFCSRLLRRDLQKFKCALEYIAMTYFSMKSQRYIHRVENKMFIKTNTKAAKVLQMLNICFHSPSVSWELCPRWILLEILMLFTNFSLFRRYWCVRQEDLSKFRPHFFHISKLRNATLICLLVIFWKKPLKQLHDIMSNFSFYAAAKQIICRTTLLAPSDRSSSNVFKLPASCPILASLLL